MKNISILDSEGKWHNYNNIERVDEDERYFYIYFQKEDEGKTYRIRYNHNFILNIKEVDSGDVFDRIISESNNFNSIRSRYHE